MVRLSIVPRIGWQIVCGDELGGAIRPGINALPLLAMARAMEINVLEGLGATEIPEPLQPVRSVLP